MTTFNTYDADTHRRARSRVVKLWEEADTSHVWDIKSLERVMAVIWRQVASEVNCSDSSIRNWCQDIRVTLAESIGNPRLSQQMRARATKQRKRTPASTATGSRRRKPPASNNRPMRTGALERVRRIQGKAPEDWAERLQRFASSLEMSEDDVINRAFDCLDAAVAAVGGSNR